MYMINFKCYNYLYWEKISFFFLYFRVGLFIWLNNFFNAIGTTHYTVLLFSRRYFRNIYFCHVADSGCLLAFSAITYVSLSFPNQNTQLNMHIGNVTDPPSPNEACLCARCYSKPTSHPTVSFASLIIRNTISLTSFSTFETSVVMKYYSFYINYYFNLFMNTK